MRRFGDQYVAKQFFRRLVAFGLVDLAAVLVGFGQGGQRFESVGFAQAVLSGQLRALILLAFLGAARLQQTDGLAILSFLRKGDGVGKKLEPGICLDALLMKLPSRVDGIGPRMAVIS